MARWLHRLCWAAPLVAIGYAVVTESAASWVVYLPLLACPLSMVLLGWMLTRRAGEPPSREEAVQSEERPSS